MLNISCFLLKDPAELDSLLYISIYISIYFPDIFPYIYRYIDRYISIYFLDIFPDIFPYIFSDFWRFQRSKNKSWKSQFCLLYPVWVTFCQLLFLLFLFPLWQTFVSGHPPTHITHQIQYDLWHWPSDHDTTRWWSADSSASLLTQDVTAHI